MSYLKICEIQAMNKVNKFVQDLEPEDTEIIIKQQLQSSFSIQADLLSVIREMNPITLSNLKFMIRPQPSLELLCIALVSLIDMEQMSKTIRWSSVKQIIGKSKSFKDQLISFVFSSKLANFEGLFQKYTKQIPEHLIDHNYPTDLKELHNHLLTLVQLFVNLNCVLKQDHNQSINKIYLDIDSSFIGNLNGETLPLTMKITSVRFKGIPEKILTFEKNSQEYNQHSPQSTKQVKFKDQSQDEDKLSQQNDDDSTQPQIKDDQITFFDIDMDISKKLSNFLCQDTYNSQNSKTQNPNFQSSKIQVYQAQIRSSCNMRIVTQNLFLTKGVSTNNKQMIVNQIGTFIKKYSKYSINNQSKQLLSSKDKNQVLQDQNCAKTAVIKQKISRHAQQNNYEKKQKQNIQTQNLKFESKQNFFSGQTDIKQYSSREILRFQSEPSNTYLSCEDKESYKEKFDLPSIQLLKYNIAESSRVIKEMKMAQLINQRTFKISPQNKAKNINSFDFNQIK